MHKFAKQIMDCVKAHVDGIGIENFEGQNLDDLKDWTEIAKNIVCFDKDYNIVEAMKNSEDEEIMRMVEEFGDYPGRRYYNEYRYSNGRFAPKGHGTRRGYVEPPYYHQMPEDYHEWERMPEYDRMRDLDRMSMGKMYYSEPMSGNNGMSTGTHDAREGRAGMSRRSYMETKEMHNGNSPEDKDAKMKELEKYMKSLSEDVTELFSGMSPEEKQLTKTKLTTLVTKM